MEVNKVHKKLRVSSYDIVKYQLITELIFLRKEHMIQSDIELLTLLVLWGPIDLGAFCSNAAKELYKDALPEEFSIRAQNVRNRLVKLEKRDMITKTKTGKKVIKIHPALNIHGQGNILLDYNILAIESTQA